VDVFFDSSSFHGHVCVCIVCVLSCDLLYSCLSAHRSGFSVSPMCVFGVCVGSSTCDLLHSFLFTPFNTLPTGSARQRAQAHSQLPLHSFLFTPVPQALLASVRELIHSFFFTASYSQLPIHSFLFTPFPQALLAGLRELIHNFLFTASYSHLFHTPRRGRWHAPSSRHL